MTARLSVAVPPDYWLTMNRTVTNHGYRRRIIEALHAITVAAAERQHFPAAPVPCIATWTVHYPKGVGDRADAVNAAPTTKALLDALCPRWIPGDDRRYVAEERFRRGPNLDEQGGHLVVLTLQPCGLVSVGDLVTADWSGFVADALGMDRDTVARELASAQRRMTGDR